MISSKIYTGDGTTKVFPVSFDIVGENYVQIWLDGVAVDDRTTYDIINNSIVFLDDYIPANEVEIEITVATTAQEIADLNTPPSGIIEVSNAIDNINVVANNITNIDAVADIDSDVTTVAGIDSDVTTVAGIDSDVTTVASNESNINTVATDITNINSVATTVVPNIAEILTADDSATTATAQATLASGYADAAEASADRAEASADRVDMSNVLEKDNTTAFTPDSDYEPATKKYVDENSGGGFEKPDTEGVLFTKTSPSALTIPVGFSCRVGEVSIEVTTNPIALNLTDNLVGSTKTAGTDYYIYVKADGSFYLSADKTITADRLIGGFHYGLVGEAETATGNKTESDMAQIRGINSYSFWDLKFRPIASPKGMVFVKGRWYDIYLCNSEHITNGTSKAGTTIAGGESGYGRAYPKIPLEFGGDNTLTYGSFKWFHACEIAKANAKQLIDYAEFQTIAYGVQEGSDAGAVDGGGATVEHYDYLTSKWGIEQATGTQWIWGADVNADANSGSWQSVTEGRGSIYANSNELNAVILGARRYYGGSAGSRASDWNNCVWNSIWIVGARFSCDHLELV